MPKTKISEFSATPGNNTDIDGINIAEGCAPSGINDAIRELMSQLKDFQAGTAGDSFNGPVGTTTAAAGAFTNLSASGTFALTGDQVQISEGGTGQTTANAAFNALAPSQATHAGKYLKTDGTNTSWDALDISTADITGTLPVANGGTGVTSSTGTGSVVLSASPTFTGTVNGASLTLSSNFTLSGGTANGVAYLNGSKVLTTGSALSFDGTNFRAVSNARIEGTGVGITGSGDGAEIYSNSGITYFQGLNRTSLTYIPIVLSGGTYIAQTLGGSEQMRLTSTGLGIGTSSPLARLTVSDSTATNGSMTLGNNASYHGKFEYTFSTGELRISQVGTGSLGTTFYTNGVERLRIDSSGNLGLGTTTPTNSGGYSTLSLNGSTGGQLVFQTGGTYKQSIYSSSTDLNFYNSVAGNLAFFTNATERARITSGGDLLVGTTSGQVSATVVAYRPSAATACVGPWNAATTGDNLFVVFNTEATATLRGSIDYNRAGGLTRYNTTSDYRAKDIIGPAKNTGATIDALKVYEGVMKGATQSRPMMIAHEAQAVVPFCVSGEKDAVNADGTPKYQQVDHASLVPLLIAELQSLRARVAALETK